MDGLRDIKGLMSIDDFSLYIFVIIVILCLIAIFFIIKKIINYQKVVSPLKIAKNELKNLDLKNSKESAYKLCKYGALLSDENFEYLEKYKYKKDVTGFSSEDLKKIKGFLDAI